MGGKKLALVLGRKVVEKKKGSGKLGPRPDDPLPRGEWIGLSSKERKF